jgi:RNA polymerase sigma-70 factor, ECF subfamily
MDQNETKLFGWSLGSLSEEASRDTSLRGQIERHFAELRDPVYRYLRSCGAGGAQAEEITQEAFVRLYREAARGTIIANVRPWICRVAHNLLVDESRKQFGAVIFDSAVSEAVGNLRHDPALNPEQQLLSYERLKLLQARLATLTDLQRQALFLRVEGFRYREIAEILGVERNAVVDRIRRALKRLGSDVSV